MSSKKDLPITKKLYQRIPLNVSVYLRYLHQDLGIRGKDLLKRYPKYSPASIYKHAVKNVSDLAEDKRRNNAGRPHKLTSREERKIVREIGKLRETRRGNFSVKDLKTGAGICTNVCDMTVRRVLYRNGYRFRNCRRKGILTKKDTKVRLQFAKHARKMLNKDIWCKTISFYLDGAGFTHKYNPMENALRTHTKTWRRKDEGLSMYCTTSGTREGVGGRVAKFMVSIAYGKGVTMCHEYKPTLNGTSFSEFLLKHFPPCFKNSANPEGKIFLQDGDPSQNSKLAMDVLAEIGGNKFAIPPRSPDMNPIENLFHLTKKKLKSDAIENKITKETYTEFVTRVKDTMLSTPIDLIDRIIYSMDKRIDLVITCKGQRIKY